MLRFSNERKVKLMNQKREVDREVLKASRFMITDEFKALTRGQKERLGHQVLAMRSLSEAFKARILLDCEKAEE